MTDVKVVYELEFDIPSLQEGAGIQIPGLGTFENGQKYEVSEEEANAYRSYHMKQVSILGESGEILGSDAELGPTLKDAADSMLDGISVTEVNKTVHADENSFSGDPDEPPVAPPSEQAPEGGN